MLRAIPDSSLPQRPAASSAPYTEHVHPYALHCCALLECGSHLTHNTNHYFLLVITLVLLVMGWRDRGGESSSKFHHMGGSRTGPPRPASLPRHNPPCRRLLWGALFLLALSFLLSSPPSLTDLLRRRPRGRAQGKGHWGSDTESPWDTAGGGDGSLPDCTPQGPQGEASLGQGRQEGRGLRASVGQGVGPRIEGSVLGSAEEVLLFRGRWECIATHHGSWVLNPTPRPIPVRDEVQEVSKNQICRRLINNSDLAPINAAVRKGLVAPASWAVPDSLKYQWQVSPPGACGAPLRPRTPAQSRPATGSQSLPGHSDTLHLASSVSEEYTEIRGGAHTQSRLLSEGQSQSSPASGAHSQSGSHAEPDPRDTRSYREAYPGNSLRSDSVAGSSNSPGTDLQPFDGELLCQAFDRLRTRLARGLEGSPGSLEAHQGTSDGSRGDKPLPPLEVFVVGDSLSAAFMSSLEAQMKLSMGPRGARQVPPEGRCAGYTRGVKKLHPAYANVGEQWYEQGHYIWHGTHCATLHMCHARGQGGGEGVSEGEGKGGGGKEGEEGQGKEGEEGGVRVHFGRTMHLSWLSASPEAEKLFLEEPWEKLPYAWADEMVERNASVALLNTGAFHQPHKVFLKRLNFTLTLLRKKLPHLLLIYRSTSSAHLECAAFQGPVPIPRSVCGAPYHWGEFAVQNKLARRIVEDVGGVWMDVFTMTELRPDWHLHSGDCLHYCAPGPIDTWVELWMNMLQELL